jgi:cytochrome P450
MTSAVRHIPPGPSERYNTSQDLLVWMSDQFSRFGEIFSASVYGTNVYVVSDPAGADHVLRRNWQNYKKGQAIKRIGLLLGNGLMVSEAELWKSQRRMIQPAFHEKTIGELITVITRGNAELLEKWRRAAQSNDSVNITNEISHMILSIVLISIFGDDYEEVAPRLNILSDESARNIQFAQTFRPLGKIVAEVAGKRRKERTKATDILGMLMEARDRDSGRAMTDSQLVSEVMTLIVAGHETTASTLNWVWYLLSRNSDVEEKLQRELDVLFRNDVVEMRELSKFVFTRQVIEEALRMYPAGWLLTRKALRDDQIGDYFVPAGTEIYISPYLIQRHPGHWKDPDRFCPERFAPSQSHNRHELTMMPFSAGPRKCIGEMLARVEMQIHLMMIAKHLRLRYASERPVELEAGVNLRCKYDFIMIPEIRQPNGSNC